MQKTFGLSELKNGYFPHLFNTPDIQKYVGYYPASEYYGVEFMSVDEYQTFSKWHKKQKHKIFDLKIELEEYCRSDVVILLKSCLKFRELFMLVTTTLDSPQGIHPFISCLKMPSVCLKVYGKQFMPIDSIALIPAFGLHEATSFKAILWLKYIAVENNIHILHARNGKEKNW